MSKIGIDKVDARILDQLQQDSRITNQDLADHIGMSTSPCWRRVKNLENEQIIRGYGVLLDRKKMGLGVMVFIRVSIDCHSELEAKKFEQQVSALEYVVACYSIGGDADFLLQVVSPDLDTYAEFSMSIIRRLPGIKEMQSMFVLKEIKPFLAYPVQVNK